MKLFFSLLFVSLTACQSPMYPIKNDVANFKKQYGNHFVKYQGDVHPMQMVWSGDESKPPIIFVHGSPGSWDAWAHFLMDAELQKNFHLIAVDRPGFGGSDYGKTEPSVTVQSKDILKALQFNKSGKKAIVVGHSYAGGVLPRMALEQPDKISGLVYIACSVDPSLEKVRWYNSFFSWWPMRSLIAKHWRVSNEEIMRFEPELAAITWDRITADVALIQGKEDALVEPENYDFLLRVTDPERVKFKVLVPGQGHFILWQKPEYVFQAIQALTAKK